MNSEIGLVIWGCKGGYRVFCTNGVVDYNIPVIADTIKDIREFVRFNQSKLNVYALEFTDKYKVYTLYRSCNDSGIGAYVAITIYVPHTLRVPNIREVLYSMMNKYFDDYIHPLSNTYIPGKYDDVKPFNALLANSSRVENEPKKEAFNRSVQDNTPQIRLYADLGEVDGFFLHPYRKEFFACQEVMFMSREIYDKIPETLHFQRTPTLIDSVSDPEPLPELDVSNQSWSLISSLMVNNIPVTINTHIQVSDYDQIALILTKKYYNDIVVNDSVEALMRKGLLRKQGNRLMLTLESLSFIPHEYVFKVTVNGKQVPEQFIGQSFNRNNNYQYITGSSLTVTGDKIERALYWGVKNPHENKLLPAPEPIKLVDKIDVGRIELKVDSYKFGLKVGDVANNELTISISHIEALSFPIKANSESVISFKIPGGYDKSDFTFRCGKNAVTLNENIIKIEPNSKEYRLKIHDFDTTQTNWWLKGKSENIRPTNGAVSVRSKGELEKFNLIIDNYTFEKILTGNEIIPKGYIVRNLMAGLDVVYVKYNGEKRPVYDWAIFPAKPEIDKHIYDVKTKERKPLIILTVGRKQTADGFAEYSIPESTESDSPSSSAYNPYIPSYNPNDRRSRQSNEMLNVTFINCKGFSLNGHSISQEEECRMLSGITTIHRKRKECIIYDDLAEYNSNPDIDKKNRDNGFIVSYSSDGLHCTVEYTSDKPNILKIFRTRIFFGIIGILFLGVIAYGSYKLWFQKEKDMLVLKFMVENNVSDELQGEDAIHINSLDSLKSVTIPNCNLVHHHNEDSTILLVKYDAKFLKDVCNNNEMEYVNKILCNPITVTWGNGYREEWSVDKDPVVYSKIINALKEYQNNIEIDTITISKKPQALTVWDKFINESKENRASKTYSLAKDAAKNSVLKPYLLNKCWEITDKTDIKMLSTFKNYVYFKDEPLYSQEYTDSADIQIQLINSKEELEADIKNKKISFINKLHNIKCSASTVKQIEKELKKLNSENYKSLIDFMKPYLDAYNTFFNAKKKTDMDPLCNSPKKDLFSKEQKTAIGKYCYNTNTFNMLKDKDRLFTTPEKYGVKNEKY